VNSVLISVVNSTPISIQAENRSQNVRIITASVFSCSSLFRDFSFLKWRNDHSYKTTRLPPCTGEGMVWIASSFLLMYRTPWASL